MSKNKISNKELAAIKQEVVKACHEKNDAVFKKYYGGDNPVLNPDDFITENYTGLMACSYFKFKAGIAYLLELGAKANFQNTEGISALHVASQVGYPNSCVTLLNKKANINIQTKFLQTPMMFACQNGDETTNSLLMEKNADLTLKDVNQKTCLDYAKIHEHFDLVKIISHAILSKTVPEQVSGKSGGVSKI